MSYHEDLFTVSFMPVMTRTARHHEMTISMIDSSVSPNNGAEVGVRRGFASLGQDTARGRRHRGDRQGKYKSTLSK
jgi:hypothetical protein